MNANEIRSAAVIGAGTMGHGIAQVLASIEIETRLIDAQPAALEHGLAQVRANLDKGVLLGKLPAEKRAATLALLRGANSLEEGTAGVSCVIEAVPEKLALKQEIFRRLAQLCAPEVLLATNTSSLPIGAIAGVCRAPERVVGMHFFNPVHLMKLVEVVRAAESSEAAVQCALALARRMGKEPIDVRDSPGFASSRLGICIGMEAIRMLESGVASAEDIDKAMVLGYGFPMGPLRLTDQVGLDVRLAIAEHLAAELGPRFEPPQLLRQMVGEGKLGKKSKQGFYRYE